MSTAAITSWGSEAALSVGPGRPNRKMKIQMNDNRLKTRRVASAVDPDFAALARIYTEAHPESERKKVTLLASMVERPEYLFLVAAQDCRVVGFSIILCFSGTDACLLEYMAVSSDVRDQGIGQYLFRESVNRDEVFGRYLLAEVDSDKLQTAERTDCARRKAFYRRLGCREVEGLCYIMPPVSISTPPAMDLLVYRSELPPSIDRSQLRNWLQSCYTEVYGMAANDPRIDAMLKTLPAELRLV